MAERSVGNTALKLSALAVAMFVFAIYVMPPLYDAFCEITGLNGKGAEQAVAKEEMAVDESRTIRVTFTSTNNELMPWDFKPNDAVMEVHPGEIAFTSFHAKNTTDKYMVSRAIPSFAPSNAAEYFHKTECFCFDNQPLEAGESAEMGIQFYIDPNLPKSIRSISASYTIFDITEIVEESEQKVSQR